MFTGDGAGTGGAGTGAGEGETCRDWRLFDAWPIQPPQTRKQPCNKDQKTTIKQTF